ncbi:hypothetical protein [Streptomyces sp. enrichment culture]|uniref:hypothetical protein n=1 Tax=Streptomyces sp. enrichment culture TaxID=1795815 RepID=UPI003F576710
MSFSPSPRVPSGARRRTLLASAAGGVLLAGCSSEEDGNEAAGGSPALGERVRVRAARDSAGLVERYDAVIAAHPALAERLGPLREETVRHAAAFGGVRKSARPSSAPPSPPAVTTPKDALAGLAAAERALADRRAQDLLGVPGELARLLASVAAAGAAHAYLLAQVETEGGA